MIFILAIALPVFLEVAARLAAGVYCLRVIWQFFLAVSLLWLLGMLLRMGCDLANMLF